MLSAERLVAQVGKLAALPTVYLEVKRLIDDPDSGLPEIGAAVSQDPALTARLLRIANSPYFGFASEIDTVTRAINMMGTEQLHDLILATAVAKTVSEWPSTVVDINAFWRESVSCGIAARLIANHSNDLDGERLFVAGLLHSIGQLVLWHTVPDEMLQVSVRLGASGAPRDELERLMLGLDYAQVGQAMLKAWQLPRMLQVAVGGHLLPAKTEDFIFETAIVHAAAILASTRGGEDPAGILRRISPSVSQQLALTSEIVTELVAEVERQLAETMALFTASAPKAHS